MSATSALFTPLKAGAVSLRNRIGMSALTRNRASATGVPTDLNVEYYRQRAAGSAGIIVSEGVLVGPQGTEWPFAPGIWNDEQVSAWKKVVDAVHGEGAKIFAQLWHVGRVAHPDAPQQKEAGIPVYAPSAIAARGGKFRFLPGEPGYVTPTAIEDPSTLLPLWKKAAVNAKAAGFDGVEIHGANGYLLHEFLDSTANTRTDAWGGSPQNRARFPLEVLKTVSEVYGSDRVSIKLSPTGGYNDVGMPLDETIETFSYLISEADKLKLAYICLVRYSPFTDIVIDGKNRATKHDVVATYAPLIKNSAKFANSGFTGEEAAKFVADGTLDGVFFGVPWITNPDAAKRLQAGKELNMNVDFMTLYGTGSPDEEVQKKGYTDYPTAT